MIRRSRHLSTRIVIVVCLVGASMLSGCGFQPRGSLVGAAAGLRSVFVDAERDLSITQEVREALLDASFTLAPNRDAANILLRLNGEVEAERVVSVTSNGRISELELMHAVNMQIAQSQNDQPPVYNPDQRSNRVEVNREYTYDETGVLGKENEARILREEMKRDLVRQIVLRSIARLTPSVSG